MPRRRNPGFMTGSVSSNWGKLAAAAAGAALASTIPQLEMQPVAAVPVSVGGAIGLYLFAFSKGGGGYARWLGLGMALSAIQPVVDQLVSPLTSQLGGGTENA